MAESTERPKGIAALREELIAALPPVRHFDFSDLDEDNPYVPTSIFDLTVDFFDTAEDSEPRDPVADTET